MPYKVKIPATIYTDDLKKLGDSVVNLSRWCEDEFNEVASSFQATEPDFIWNSVPPKPRRGIYAYADGTNWNPGKGEGPYFYNGSVWSAMNAGLCVAKSGDTMTGSLNINPGGLNLTAASSGIEIGSISASNTPYIDFHSSGNNIDYDVRLIATGGTAATGNGNLQLVGSFSTTAGVDAGTNVIANAGYVQSCTSGAAGQGLVYLGNTGTAFLNYDGTRYNLPNAPLGSYGRAGRQGISGGSYGSIHNWYWTGSVVQIWVDSTNLGNLSSDYRIKKDVADLPGMWDTVKKLRPIKYTHADFSPPSHIKFVAEEKKAGRAVINETFFKADSIERWGFVAHEVQKHLLPSAAEGEKDADDTIQSLNLAPIVAALTKALQEAMARIEELESRL